MTLAISRRFIVVDGGERWKDAELDGLEAAVRHIALVRELNSGSWQPGRVSRGAVLLAILLALTGAGMAAYLLILR